jgi:hypothetical protein
MAWATARASPRPDAGPDSLSPRRRGHGAGRSEPNAGARHRRRQAVRHLRWRRQCCAGRTLADHADARRHGGGCCRCCGARCGGKSGGEGAARVPERGDPHGQRGRPVRERLHPAARLAGRGGWHQERGSRCTDRDRAQWADRRGQRSPRRGSGDCDGEGDRRLHRQDDREVRKAGGLADERGEGAEPAAELPDDKHLRADQARWKSRARRPRPRRR